MLLTAGTLPAGCGSDDDEKRSSWAQNCVLSTDPCERCTCQVCSCDSECDEGTRVVAECFDGCLSRDGGDLLACFDDCKGQTTGSTREYVICLEAALRGACSSPCPF
jgi:hypothetical protein